MAAKPSSGMVQIFTHDTYEKVVSSAYGESANTAGWTFPVVIFQQSSRVLLSGAFPIGFVESRLISRSAAAGANAKSAKDSMNRPEIKGHIKSIAKYLRENVGKKYIIPPLTLNVQEKVTLHTIENDATFKAGYLVIPAGVNLSITDGQHRVKGLFEAMVQMEKEGDPALEILRRDSISVMITCENDLKQIHQDFADCSKTKPLPSSLLTLYDTRNPGNRLVFDIEENTEFFRGRLDSTSKTLSKKSAYLFLSNQLRQFVKHMLLRGNPADDEFERRASELLRSEAQYQRYFQQCIQYINILTASIPIWKEISEIPIDSPKRQLIPKYRDEGWLCLTATGLNVLGSIGYDLFTYGVENWQEAAQRIGGVDWRRNGQLWQGSIVQDGRLVTQTAPVRKASKALRAEIGLPDEMFETKMFN